MRKKPLRGDFCYAYNWVGMATGFQHQGNLIGGQTIPENRSPLAMPSRGVVNYWGYGHRKYPVICKPTK